jgi:hypothetical protein
LLATAFFVTAPLAGAAATPSIRNFVRSFAAASQAGAGPRPLHVAPLFGSRYFVGKAPLPCPARAMEPAAAEVFLSAAFALLTPLSLTAPLAPSIRNFVRSRTFAIQAGGRA